MQYGTLNLPNQGQAGPYRVIMQRADGSWTGFMRLTRNPGHPPSAGGNY